MKKRKWNTLYVLGVMLLIGVSSFVFADSAEQCFITPKLAEELKGLILVIQYLAAALVIILTIIDILKIIMKPDKDEKIKGRPDIIKSIVVRALTLVAVFFIPTIIKVIFNLVGWDVYFCGLV